MDALSGAPFRLDARLSARTRRRLARARRLLAGTPFAARLPQARRALAALDAALGAVPPDERAKLLRGPDLRGFLAEAEIWTEAHRLAAAAPGGARGDAVRARLFDLISRTEFLALLAPRGRIDPAFARRVRRFALRRLREAAADVAACAVGIRLAWPAPGLFPPVELLPRADAEQGRARGRVDLGAVAGPAGALALAAPDSARLTVRCAAGTLALRAPSGAAAAFPAAGSRLRFRGTEKSVRAGRFALERRAAIPGTPILLGALVVCGPRGLTVRRTPPAAAARLARALRVVQAAWPAAHREILERTRVVVPVREPGTVSWSLAARPGISFINLAGKSIVDLADDLLHETAHHRLHDMQEVETYLAKGEDSEAVQAFDSPWRGAKRPLHGVLHGCFTFLHRSELFERLLALRTARPRLDAAYLGDRGVAWLRAERTREGRRIAAALSALKRAGREGLLTSRGRRLVGALSRWYARLARRGGGTAGDPAR